MLQLHINYPAMASPVNLCDAVTALLQYPTIESFSGWLSTIMIQ